MKFYRDMSYRQRLRMDVPRTALEFILLVIGYSLVLMSSDRESSLHTTGVGMLVLVTFMLLLELRDAIGRIRYRKQQNKKKPEAAENVA